MERLIDVDFAVAEMRRNDEKTGTSTAVEVVRCEDCKYSYCNKYCTNDR